MAGQVCRASDQRPADRPSDPRLRALAQKWLKAGVMEDGRWFETKEGTPQGAVISPILANLYLHYVLDALTHASVFGQRHAFTHASVAEESGAGRYDHRPLR
jgi:retron-type reverse transcriptase